MPELDSIAERASRWLAARSTRRSFLGRVGRGAVLVASGSTVASLLLGDEAEARVCGQSGVSPKCATYDCDAVWGWCWYATGCCAGGELKKICDCCAKDWPNVHGYCPAGTNVKCIVESCGADPRLQVVTLHRLPWDDPVAVSAGASKARHAEGSVPEVWLVEAGQGLLASVIAPFAARAGAPVLLCAPDRVPAALVAELQRLGTRRAVLVGPQLSDAVAAGLRRYAIEPRRMDVEPPTELSARLARDMLDAGARRMVCVEPGGLSLAAAPMAAALAAAKGYPLVVGVDQAKALAARADGPRPVLTYLVAAEAARRAGEVPGGQPLHSAGWQPLAAEIADAAFRVENADGSTIALVAQDAVPLAALLAARAVILPHLPGVLDGIRDTLFAFRDRFRSVALAGASGALTTSAYYELQSIVNGFEAHKLIGVAGQGLPVIDQPLAERPIGLARRSAAPEPAARAYWTGRGLDLDGG